MRKRKNRTRLKHLINLDRLLQITQEMLAAQTSQDLLQRVVDAARDLTGAKHGIVGYDYSGNDPQVIVSPRGRGTHRARSERAFSAHRFLLDRLKLKTTIRWTDDKLREHPDWGKACVEHSPAIRGLLGVGLEDQAGSVKGMLLVTGKRNADFTEEDEALLAQLGALTSLGLQHIEACREAERQAAQLKLILESINEGVTVLDAGGRTILRNRMADRISGLREESLGDISCFQGGTLTVLKADGTPMAYDDLPVVRLLKGESPVQEELYYQRADGSRARVSQAGILVPMGQGLPPMAVITTRDVTELYDLERSKEDYLRMVSHDLRSPLAVVQSWSQLAEKAADDPDKVRTCMAKILSAVGRMNAMIRDLVDAARLDARKLTLKTQPTLLTDYLTGLLEQIGTVLDTDRVSMECYDELPPVMADPDRLERIFVNLLTNALRYSPSGTPVEVSLAGSEKEVVVAVRDHGPGIDEENRGQLFERFYRAHASPEREEGLGLGLFIAKGLVEAHGGRIWAECAEGGGSVFSFSLPAASSEEMA